MLDLKPSCGALVADLGPVMGPGSSISADRRVLMAELEFPYLVVRLPRAHICAGKVIINSKLNYLTLVVKLMLDVGPKACYN